jgi:DNA-binding LacI/PurR family transcriptional regulator
MTNQNRVKKNLEPARGGVTLADVAAQAGVSTVAASVVLNGSRSGARVSPATRERIIEVASALSYRPNAVARSLRRKRTDIFAFYSAYGTSFDPRYPFYGALLAGMQAECAELGRDLLVHGHLAKRDDEVLGRLLDGQVDGLVLYARFSTPLTERLMESHLPVVTVVNEVPGVPCVGIDDEQGGRLLARRLASAGYRRVLYRRTNENEPATLKRRFSAFCAEAQVLGLELLYSSSSDPYPEPDEAALLLGPRADRPDAVACWSDYAADGVADFCAEHGLRVPQDIAIVGFDGLASMRRPALDLTTVRAPWDEVASTAVRLLTQLCQGESVPGHTLLPVQLHIGATT